MLRLPRLFPLFGLYLTPMTIKFRTGARARFPAAILCGLVLWGNEAAANEALDLLNRMQSAVHGLDYNGQLVYSRGDELATFRITHSSGQGGERENIIRLNPSEGSSAGQTESFSLANFDNLHPPGQQNYSFDLGGDAWVAEYPCKVVVVRPKDKLRYLHRYCIEPTTGMLLQYSLMDREQKLLEQLLFTQLAINKTTLIPAVASSAPSLQAQVQVAPAVDMGTRVLGNWDFSALPAGFRVIKVIAETGIEGAHQVVLSDGLTSVSVFIAPAALAEDINELSYSTGATHVLGQEMAGHVIAFVGEVPTTTLQSIQKGLRYVGP